MKDLVAATLKILTALKPKDKKNEYNFLETQFLYMFIEEVLLRTLNLPTEGGLSKKEKFEFVRDNFEVKKRDIQEAIAFGFQEALEKYSRVSIDYVCTVKALPKSKSTVAH